MTHENTDQIDQKLTLEITRIFEQKYKNIPSAAKWISRKTGIPPETVRRWNKGRNSPRSGHLIILARRYPEVLKVFFGFVGHNYLIPYISLPDHEREIAGIPSRSGADSGENVPINVPLKSWPSDLNERQKWFLVELHCNIKVTAADIVRRWAVTDKTARRDIADLKERGLIAHVGARKSGWYEMAGTN
jgi:hypothetical protein